MGLRYRALLITGLLCGIAGADLSLAQSAGFFRDMTAKGVEFSMPPKKQDFGGVLAQFVDSEGANCSVGEESA